MLTLEGGGARACVRTVAVVAVLGAALLVYAGLATTGTDAAGGAWVTDVEPGQDPGRELPALRTETSRTFELPSGQLAAQVYATRVNFRGVGGEWQPIDNELVEDPDERFALRNEANDYAAHLPANLSDPVRFELDGHWAELRLVGASAEAASKGDTVTYDDALPGASVSLTATNGGLKENVVLSGADSQAEFRYRLAASEGLTAREDRSGGVALADGGGRPRIRLAAPFMTDATGVDSHAVTMEVVSDAVGQALVVRADRGWLSAPERKFPVAIDPTWVAGPEADCGIVAGSSANQNFCSQGIDKVGYDGTKAYRALMRYDIEGVVPRDSQVTRAALVAHVASKTGATPVNVSAHRVTTAWTSGMTWNKRDGVNAWTSAGGDFDPQVEDTDHLGSYGAPDYYKFERLQKLAQGWLEDPAGNRGVLLKAASEGTTNNVFSITSPRSNPDRAPYLYVTYEPRVGAHRYYNIDSQRITDRMSLGVNVASGNLMLTERDVSIAGTGLDLALTRTYNSRLKQTFDLGDNWQVSAGARLSQLPDTGDLAVQLPTGAVGFFRKLSNGTFVTPTGVDATMTAIGVGQGWRLRMHQSSEVLEFNQYGMLVKHTDRNGNHIDFSYDASDHDRLIEVVDTQGRELDIDHNGAGYISEISDPTGRTWQYGYTGDLLTSYTNPGGEVTSYEYGAESRLTRVTTPDHREVVFGYDGSDRVNKVTRVTNFTNDTGPTTQYNYGAAITPTCAADQARTLRTDPRGKLTNYCSDDLLRVTKAIDAYGNARSTTYTANSDPSTETAPGSSQKTFGYDSLDNLTSVGEPAGEASAFEYNATGHPHLPSKQTSPQGTSSGFAYDTSGNTTTVTDGGSPTQVEAALEYNGQSGGQCPNDATTKPGTLRCAIDGKDNRTLYGYDDPGNLTSITPELPLGDTTITYDGLSRVHTVEDGKGQVRIYTYDDLDRVVEIEYTGGPTIAFEYDPDGNRLGRLDSVHGTSTWDYDALGRRIEDTLPPGTTTYAWDASSNLTSLTDGGGTVSYRYDDVNRVKDLTEPGGSCVSPVSLCTTFGYTNRDQRERTTYPNGVEQTVTFDSSDKPTRIRAIKGATVLTDFTYVYDEASPGTRKTRLRQSVTDKDGNKTAYGYDFLDRLTSAVERNSASTIIDNRAYTYDFASNRKSQTINGATTSYAYNAANQLCWTYNGVSSAACGSPPGGATTYSYDANGNTTASSAGLAFSYNLRDQTTSFTPPGGTATSFAYAGTGQSERTSIAGLAQNNTLLGLSRRGTTSWTRDPGGTLISQRASSTRHYYLNDSLGSVVGLTDSVGAMTRTYKYDPYGIVRSTTGSTANPFQYTGEHREAQGELYKIGARYYQPGFGRWSQVDPFDQAGDIRDGNRYAYAAGDPVNLLDPTGTSIWQDIVDVGGAIKDAASEIERRIRNLGRSKSGRCLIGGVIYAGGSSVLTADWRIRLFAGAVGCAAGVTRRGF